MAHMREQARWQQSITQYILDSSADVETKRLLLSLRLADWGIGPSMTATTPAKLDALIQRMQSIRDREGSQPHAH